MMILVTGYTAHLCHRGDPNFGLFTSPLNGQRADREGIPYGVDNDVFSGKFDYDRWVAFISKLDSEHCLFAAAPDVVGDWDQTRKMFWRWCHNIEWSGLPPAVVLQDGATIDTVPWDRCAAIFIGGTDAFKLSKSTIEPLARKANRLGKWVHMGRVNSMARMRYAKNIGCDSVDGTFSKYDPPRVARFLRWLSGFNKQESFKW